MGASHDVAQDSLPCPLITCTVSLPSQSPHDQHLNTSNINSEIKPKDTNTITLHTSSSIQTLSISDKQKADSRLKRTIETMATGMERIIGKMGLSRPMRDLATMKQTQSTALPDHKETSGHALTESNSFDRPYRSTSKSTKQKASISYSSTLITRPDMPDFEESLEPLRQTSPVLEPVVSKVCLKLAFPASAGAGAKASVAKHKRSHPMLSLLVDEVAQENQSLDHSNKNDSPISERMDLELLTTKSWADSMDLDNPEYETYPDPVQALPSEIVYIIFSQLDLQSLLNASQVSRSWRDHTNVNTVWRDFFLSNYSPSKNSKTNYLQIGGLGLGKQGRVSQPWKKMACARMQLDKSWEEASPAATYFCGHTDSVYCCQFDEEKIITGSRDRTIRVWDINTKKCLKVIGSPSNKPSASSGSGSLATHKNMVANVESVNGTIEGDNIFHIPSYYHHASVLCLQFDDEIMVTGSSDSTCIVWDIKTYEPLAHLCHHGSGVLDVCFDNKYIISCSKDHTICIWSRKDYKLVKVLSQHTGPVNAVQMRGTKMVSASGDGNSRLWDMESFECERVFTSRDRGLAAVEFSDDGQHILAGGNDQVIYKYDALTAEVVHTFCGHTNLVRSLFLDCNNGRVLSGSYDQGIRVFSYDTGKEIGVFNNWTTSWILSAKCDYRRIVATSQDGRVLLMDFGHSVNDIELLNSL